MRPESVRDLDELIAKLTREKAECGRATFGFAMAFVVVSVWAWFTGKTFPPFQAETMGQLICAVMVVYFEARQRSLSTALSLMEVQKQQAWRLAELEAALNRRQ